MAIINTIRDKYAKVAGAVIVLALIGFVLTDLGKTAFQPATTAAEINGTDIDINDYNRAAANRIDAIKANNQNQPLTEEQDEQVREEVWNEMVSGILLEDVYDKLGIEVTQAEFMDMFVGVMPEPQAQQAFVNPETGQVSPDEVATTIKDLETSTDLARKNMWQGFKGELVKVRLQKKVGNLIAAGMYVPKAVLDAQDKLNNTMANVEMVQIPYTLVSDDKAVVSENEITEYIKKNKERYTQQMGSLEMDVVAIPYAASPADSAMFFANMDSLKGQFAAAADVQEFATLHSSKFLPQQTLTKDMLQGMPSADELLAAGVGSIVGPFPFQEEYAIARILEKSNIPDSVEVRHILITEVGMDGAPKRTEAEAKNLIDSIATAIKGGASFDSMVVAFSEDQGSAATAGKYTFQAAQKGSLTKEFSDFAFSGNNGETKTVYVKQAQGYSGYHYIEVIKRAPTTQSATKVQFITQMFGISDETKAAINERANQFLVNASKGGEAFDQEAQRLGLQKMPVMASPNSKSINGLGISGELVKWANRSKVGELSTIILIDNKYVIAKLTGKNEKGALMLNNAAVKTEVEGILKRKKKAAILAAEYDSKGDLQAIATASGQAPMIIDSLTFSRINNPVLNGEPRMVGYIYSSNAVVGQVSKGIEGNSGLFYIKVNAKNVMPSTQPRNIQMERQTMSSMFKTNAYRLYIGAKIQDGDIKDNRAKFIGAGI